MSNKYIEGTWPEQCVQRAFVAGAKWWEFESTGRTMWTSDRNTAEAEAVRRYGDPHMGTPTVPQDCIDRLRDKLRNEVDMYLGTVVMTADDLRTLLDNIR